MARHNPGEFDLDKDYTTDKRLDSMDTGAYDFNTKEYNRLKNGYRTRSTFWTKYPKKHKKHKSSAMQQGFALAIMFFVGVNCF